MAKSPESSVNDSSHMGSTHLQGTGIRSEPISSRALKYLRSEKDENVGIQPAQSTVILLISGNTLLFSNSFRVRSKIEEA